MNEVIDSLVHVEDGNVGKAIDFHFF